MSVSLIAYLVLQSGLLAVSVATADPIRGISSFSIVVIGTAIFTAAVIRRRPKPMAAWWFIAASALAVIVTSVATITVYGVTADKSISSMIPILLSAVPLPVLAVGLALLSRAVARPGPVDGLDAGMTALACFILLWVLVIRPNFIGTGNAAAIAVALPVSTFSSSASR